jgi:hypothetical protein
MSHAPVVLCVGCPSPLVRRVRDAAIMGQALLVESDVAGAATIAAETRPLVIVLLEDVFAFDAASFSALAADVHARIVTLESEEILQGDLEEMVVSAIMEAEASREISERTR